MKVEHTYFTTFIGLPVMNALTLSAAIDIKRVLASIVAHAMWGVMKALGNERRGLSALGGSSHITSAP
jgi:hypothetical protein